MIKEHLTRDLNLNRLYNVYLITTNNLPDALAEIISFLNSNFYGEQNSLQHPDFMLVQKKEGNIKNIAVEQIRILQDFLNKTSVISGQKAAIIYGADQMNINAANSCLKLLEDTPKNTYIFIITDKPASILSTIRSRCAKIRYYFDLDDDNYNQLGNKEIDDYYIKPLLKDTKINEKLSYLKDFSVKDRELWIEFSSNIQNLILRICKKLTGPEILLSNLELQFMQQMKTPSQGAIMHMYKEVVKLTSDTITFDLDLRASYILLINIVS